MNAIEQHINYLFQNIPETEEIKRIKNDLLLNAMDRFDELLADGKTESEALGTIIIEMGELDELLESLGYDQHQDLNDYSTNTLQEANYLIEAYDLESNKIAMGILMIMLGAGLIPTLGTFQLAEIGVILLLVLVAAAVGLFIQSGLKLESLEKSLEDEEDIFYLTDEDYQIVEDQFRYFKESERYRIPLGVMLCIASAVPLIFLAFLGQELLIERYGILLLLIMVGIGVYQFVKYGMVESAYEKALSIGEYSVAERRFQEKIEPIAVIFWMVITVVYLAWSFFTGVWHISWIIWPLAGFLWGIISVLVKMIFDKDRK